MGTFNIVVYSQNLDTFRVTIWDDGVVVLRALTPPRKAVYLSAQDVKALRDVLNKHFADNDQSPESEAASCSLDK